MSEYTWNHGAVVRGPRNSRRMCLVFTGGDFGEGSEAVLDTLGKYDVKGSFYFTGDFLRNEKNREAIGRGIGEGHVVGPHGDAHLLYCPWDERDRTLVTREAFEADLRANVEDLRRLGSSEENLTWWIPPYEWYNNDISKWAREMGHPLFCFTPGTLSHADYTEDAAKNFRSNDVIWKSIMDFEEREAAGLNGFLLLSHVGAGPGRTEKFFERLGELVEWLLERDYEPVTVPELLREARPE